MSSTIQDTFLFYSNFIQKYVIRRSITKITKRIVIVGCNTLKLSGHKAFFDNSTSTEV